MCDDQLEVILEKIEFTLSCIRKKIAEELFNDGMRLKSQNKVRK